MLVKQISDENLVKFFNESKTLTELYSKIGYKSLGCVRQKHRDVLESRLNVHGLTLDKFKQEKHENKVKNTCLYCGKPVKNLYCSPRCKKNHYDDELIKHWKETGDTRCKTQTTIRNAIRKYIYNKQECKCAICGIENSWNGKRLNFILDHIDGDASNNFEDNLRLICPNCDSQLDTYKSKNKNSARSHRKI